MAFVFLANPTAGVLDGDRLEVSIRAGAGARAHVTTPSASKIFTMPEGSARQRTDLVVEEGALLEYMPDPVIPFRGSRFAQDTRILVHPQATLIYSDILTPGRIAHDESMDYCWYRHRLSVRDPKDRPLYYEAFEIAPARRRSRILGVLGRGQPPVLATLIVVAEGDLSGVIADIPGFARQADAIAGASSLPWQGGVVVKVLSETMAAAQAVIRATWNEVRQLLYAVPAPDLRKY